METLAGAEQESATVRGLVRRVLTDPEAVAALAPQWRDLATAVSASPLEMPDWLLTWWKHYGGDRSLRFLTWWLGSQLVGLAPMTLGGTRRYGVLIRELKPWGLVGAPLAGYVGLVAGPEWAAVLRRDLADWLRERGGEWDLFHYLRLPEPPLELASLPRGWMHARLTGILDSETFVLDLRAADRQPERILGPKARHNMRQEARLFERRAGGSIELVTAPEAVPEIVAATRTLMAERWAREERYFASAECFGPFVTEAIAAMMAAGRGYAWVARGRAGIEGCVIVLSCGGNAVALLMGSSRREPCRSLSLGKNLMFRAIAEAAERGCSSYDFLWVGTYKAAFWHAFARTLESGFVGHGIRGQAAAAYVTARRILAPRIADRLRGGESR